MKYVNIRLYQTNRKRKVHPPSRYVDLRSNPGPGVQTEVEEMGALLEEQVGMLNAR